MNYTYQFDTKEEKVTSVIEAGTQQEMEEKIAAVVRDAWLPYADTEGPAVTEVTVCRSDPVYPGQPDWKPMHYITNTGLPKGKRPDFIPFVTLK